MSKRLKAKPTDKTKELKNSQGYLVQPGSKEKKRKLPDDLQRSPRRFHLKR